MKSKNQLQVLLNFVSALESAGCIVSHRGHVELPFKATAANLALSAEATRAKNHNNLARWIRKTGLVISSGIMGSTTNVVLKSGDVKICKLVRVSDGGWQLKPTSNWPKVGKIQHWPKRQIVMLSRSQRMAMH